MVKLLSSTNRIMFAGVTLLVILFVLVIPQVHLDPREQPGLFILAVVCITYAIISTWAASRWGWNRLAPLIQPLNVLSVTLAFNFLYADFDLIWITYFVIPLGAALVVDVGWAYLDGVLTASAYLSIVALHGDLSSKFGEHLMVAGVLIVFALFGGALADVVRRQLQVSQAAQSKLQDSEARFLRLADNARDVIYRYQIKPTPRFEYLSAAVTEVTGFSREEFFKNPSLLLERTYPEQAQRLAAIMDGGGFHETPVVLRWQRKDGNWIWLEMRSTPLFDTDSTLIGIDGVIRDITDSKNIETALNEKISALQAVANSQAQLIEQTQHHAAQLVTLNEIGRAVSNLQTLDNVFELIYEQIRVVVPLDAFYICLYNPQTFHVSFPFLYDDGERYNSPTMLPHPESNLAQTLHTGKARMINRTPDDFGTDKDDMIGDVTKRSASLIFVPLQAGTNIIGALSVQSYQFNAYNHEHLTLVTGIAHQAAIAIANAHLFEETHRRADEFAALYETTRDLTTAQDLNALLETITRHAIALLKGTSGGMYLYDETTQELEVAVGTHPSTPVGIRLKLGEGMAGRVAQTRQPLIVDDYRTWSGRSVKFEDSPLNAVIEVPMLYRGELIGVLVVEELGNSTHRFTEDDARLLSLFAAQAAGAVHSARLFASTQRRVAELQAVRQASLSLTSSLDLSIILQAVAENAMQLSQDAHDAHIYLYEKGSLTFGTSLWSDGRRGVEWSTPRKDGLTYTVARQGKAIIVSDMSAHPLFATTSDIGAIVGLPLKAGDEVVGVMNIAYAKPRTFTSDELSVLQLIGDHAAIAIANSRLHRAVEESEKRYRSLVENLPIAVYRVTPGPQGEFLMVNATHLKMFGFASLEELKRIHVSDLYMNPNERKGFSDRVLRDGHIVGYEQLVRRKDGTPIWVLVNAQAVYKDGHIEYFDCTATDITVRQLATLARNKAEAALEQRTRELEALLQVSHSVSAQLDLETVLTTIAKRACTLLNATEATLFLIDEPTNTLRPIVALGEYTQERLAITLRPGEGVAGWVAQNRQAANIDHAIDDARVVQVPGTPKEDETILAAPLIHHERLQGVILLNRIPATGFTQSEVDLLVGMAAQASAAIMNARLFEETRRSALEQRIVSEISSALNATLDVHQAFPVVVRGLNALIHCDRISLALLDDENQNFTMVLLDQPHSELSQGTQMPITATAAAPDILAGREHITIDLATEIDYPAERILYQAGCRSRVNLPLIVGNRSIGSLNIVSQHIGTFNQTHLPTFRQIASAIAIAWENMRLFQTESTRREELTALYELSRQLAATTNFDTIATIVVRRTVQIIRATFARLILLENDEFVVRAAYSIRELDQNLAIGHRVPRATYPFCQSALEQSEPIIISHDDPRLNSSESTELFLHLAETLCLVPLRTGEHIIGLLVLGEERKQDREPFVSEKIRLAHSISDQTASALHRAELFGELEGAYLQTVFALANAVDAKDSDTHVHSQRLAKYAIAIGKKLRLTQRELDDLYYGAILHDIGKIGVPDAILKKPGPLDESEWAKMHLHPTIGAQIMEPLPRLNRAAEIVRHHHERYDGLGYPDRLTGNDIPIGARILCVVDAYGAIIDKRVYKDSRTHEQAIIELQRCAGKQFDPQVVQVFVQLLSQPSDQDSGIHIQ